MILFVYYLKRQLLQQQQQQQQQQQLLLLITLLLLQLSILQRNFNVSAQWITVTEFSMRVPGRCTVASDTNSRSRYWQRQLFDCGGSKLLPQQQRRCIPLQHFHDGIVDCPDGSDEFCFPGYIKCGVYCVSLQFVAQCLINPRCDNSLTSPQFCDVIKKKLCSVEGTVPCKGYGECVMRKWIENGQTNCIDKSDRDPAYIAVFGIKPGNYLYPGLQVTDNISPGSTINCTDTINQSTTTTTSIITTTKFLFQIPNSNFNRIHQFNYRLKQNSENVIPNNTLHHFSNNFRNLTTAINSDQTGHNSDATYQFHSITTTAANFFTANNPNVESSKISFTYRPSTADDENLKQDDVITSNGNSVSSLSNQQQNQNNSVKDIQQVQKESEIPINQQLKEQQEDRLSANTMPSITTTTSVSSDQIACARYEYAEAQRLIPKPLCTCPPGQMPSDEYATCKTTVVSTFGIDVQEMCGGMETLPEQRSRLALLVLNRTRLPYRACIRHDGHPVTVQLDCSQCTITEFDEAFRKNSNDRYVPLRIMELSLGACLMSSLNDCDPEHADCLVNGPRYECRCHDGWNDTSKQYGLPDGRRCEQLNLLATGCITFLGYCLFWWLLLFGIIIFAILLLLCWLGYKLYQWYSKQRRRNTVQDQSHFVISESGSIKNKDHNLATIESINMNNIPNNSTDSNNVANSEERRKTVGTQSIFNFDPSRSQNISEATGRVFIKQQSVKSLDDWKKDDEEKINDKEQPAIHLESLEESFDGIKSERKENERKMSCNEIANDTDKSVSLSKQLEKIMSEETKESNESSTEFGKNTAMMTSVLQQKNTDLLAKDEKNVSQSLSETSLRTMWELFKQGTWKQSSRPSSIKSTTSSLDRLIDVFLCRKGSKTIHPDAITIYSSVCNSTEYPLDSVKIVDHKFDATAELPNFTSTAIQTCSNTTATRATTTATDDIVGNDMEQLFSAEAQLQTQVLEQKTVTETRTLTTRSTISLLPAEISMSLKTAAVQQPNPILSTATIDRSEFIQHNQQPVSDIVVLNDINEIPQKNDSIDPTTTINALQPSTVKENTVFDQEPSTIAQVEKDVKEQMDDCKPSTTTIVGSSDTQLKQLTSIMEPISDELHEAPSESGTKDTMKIQYNNTEKETSRITNEMRDALKEVTSTKPPIKRLTEEQKRKLRLSCGYHIHDNDKMNTKEDGFVRQLLAATKYDFRRKLSSISEKSIEMKNGKGQLISAPNSTSCPTTARISKDRQVPHTLQIYRDSASEVWNCFFANLMGSLDEQPTNVNGRTEAVLDVDNITMQNRSKNKSEQNRISTKMKCRTNSNISDWCQRPTSTFHSRSPWNSSPLKNGDANRIAPLQSGSTYSYQSRKRVPQSNLTDGYATTSQLRTRSITRCQQNDRNSHDIMVPASYSARLRTRLPSAKALPNNSSITWTLNTSKDQNKPVKEQLWWDAH